MCVCVCECECVRACMHVLYTWFMVSKLYSPSLHYHVLCSGFKFIQFGKLI